MGDEGGHLGAIQRIPSRSYYGQGPIHHDGGAKGAGRKREMR
jgi:hypothetical protein